MSHRFYYRGTWYFGHVSTEPSDSRPLIRVNYEYDGTEVDDNDEVLEYAHYLFEDMGLI